MNYFLDASGGGNSPWPLTVDIEDSDLNTALAPTSGMPDFATGIILAAQGAIHSAIDHAITTRINLIDDSYSQDERAAFTPQAPANILVYKGGGVDPCINITVALKFHRLNIKPGCEPNLTGVKDQLKWGANPDLVTTIYSAYLQYAAVDRYREQPSTLVQVPFARDLFRQLPQLDRQKPWCNNIGILSGDSL